MNIVMCFQSFVCATCLKSQKMGTTIGAKEGKAKEGSMTSFLQSISKMRIIIIEAIMEVLVFMQNSKDKECIVAKNELHG